MTPTLIVVLSFLTMGGAFATDTYLPALPSVAASLETSPALAQLTLTTFLVAQAAGQLVLGPISDRYGRWMPLLIGSIVFLLAGIWAALAPDIGTLIVMRFIQGLGAAAGPVIGRAVVADLTSGIRAARLFGILMMVFGIAPVISPVIGGPLTEWGGWRLAMGAIALVSALALASVWLVPESLPTELRRVVRWNSIAADFWKILKNRVFFLSTMIIMMSFGVITAWLAASAFVLQEHFGMSPTEYALVFGLNAIGYLFSGFLNTVLLRWVAPARILAVSVCVLLAGSIALLVLYTAGALPLWALIALVVVSFGATPPIMANATAIGLDSVSKSEVGSASALMGTLESLLPSAAIPLLGLFGNTPGPMIWAFLGSSAFCGVFLVALRSAIRTRVRQ